MNTFLPFESFARSAASLDYRRLGKQRVEGLQLLHGLLGKRCEYGVIVPFTGTGHVHHPASKMWREFEPALAKYVRTVCRHWVTAYRFSDTIDAQVAFLVPGVAWDSDVPMPPWLGDPAFHASHRSNLVRKDPAFYARMLRFAEGPELEYIWPV